MVCCAFWGRALGVSKLFIPRGRIVYHLAPLSKPRAVAGAIPRVLGGIVFEGATQMGAARSSGGEESQGGFKGVDGELWAEYDP